VTVAHGFASPQMGEALPKLHGMAADLATIWWPA
jgi:hypothetical protein